MNIPSDIAVESTDIKDRFMVCLDGVCTGILSRKGDVWIYDHHEDKSLTKAPTPALAIARKLARIYLSSLPDDSGAK